MKNVDYSKIYLKYDKDPLRKKCIEKILLEAVRRTPLKKNSFRVIDIGCGSGNWLSANSSNLIDYKNIKWYGVDASIEMLLLAKEKNGDINLIAASSASLPFPANFFDFVITEYTYHHFKNKIKSFREIYRTMREGATLLIRNINPWMMETCSLYYFFPKARDCDKKRFLKPQTLRRILKNIGFKRVNIHFRIIRGNEYKRVSTWVKIIRNRTHSQLNVISDKEFSKGYKKITILFEQNREKLKKLLANNITALIEIKCVK